VKIGPVVVDYHLPKALLNRYLARHVGGDRRPTFFDVPTTAPGLEAVTRAYPAIRAELDRLLEDRVDLPGYHDVDPGQRAISAAGPGRWGVFLLEILGHRPAETRARCPLTCRVLDGVPDRVQAFFSVLDPGKSVPLHEGPYLGYLRYHLALRVPRDLPPTLIVNGQRHVWREGEGILFDDSWPHAVENESREPRVVLVVDVLRPLPFWPALVNRAMTRIVAREAYGRRVARRARRYARAPVPPSA
jgi:aspartate beta-hydroxylase/beta-hydroxylase